MSSQQRPGGLTALAVINFVWGAFILLGTLASLALVAALVSGAPIAPPNMPQAQAPEFEAQMQSLRDAGSAAFFVSLLTGAGYAVLLIVSGFGYLKLKKFLGRTLGNVAAVLSVVSTLIGAMTLPPNLGGGFGLGAIIGLVYPAITLLLLNTTFKEDFVH